MLSPNIYTIHTGASFPPARTTRPNDDNSLAHQLNGLNRRKNAFFHAMPQRVRQYQHQYHCNRHRHHQSGPHYRTRWESCAAFSKRQTVAHRDSDSKRRRRRRQGKKLKREEIFKSIHLSDRMHTAPCQEDSQILWDFFLCWSRVSLCASNAQ